MTEMTMRSAAMQCCVLALALAWSAAAAPHEGPHKEAGARPAPASERLATTSGLRYQVPAVDVIDAQGRKARLAQRFETSDPVLLNFVFTTCSTICSTQTAVLAEVQRRLSADGRRARFVSITIDPANDTPARLAAFARQFAIERDWSFLTGEFDDLVTVQQAFDVYRGAKAAHPPVVLLRPAPGAAWVRVEGSPAPADLIALLDPRSRRP